MNSNIDAFDLGKTIELTYFNTILNYAQVVNQTEIEESRNARLDILEQKMDYIIQLLEEVLHG